MSTIVVATPDVVGKRMAGPGIRAWHLAQELARIAPTALIAKTEDPLPDETITVISRDTSAASEALRNAAVLVGQPARGFQKRRPRQRIVYDLFDPTVLELRELYGSSPSLRQRVHLAAEWSRLSDALIRGDLLMCAAAQQRRFYDSLKAGEASWIEVPFGIDLKETHVCPKPQDNIVLWGGGVWEWLDPATAVDAVVRVNAEGVRCKLLFLGSSRPNRDLVDRRRDDRFAALLARGGEYADANEGWVPYTERLSWLRAAKVAIMLHRATAEAEFAIRTRLFDAIAAGIPVIASAGGFAADLVEQETLGIVVPPGDLAAVAQAIRRLLTDDGFHATCVQNLERVRPRFAWDVVTRPLTEKVSEWLKQR
jgi:glycosyltransferase involved in cell wall biosynthesis